MAYDEHAANFGEKRVKTCVRFSDYALQSMKDCENLERTRFVLFCGTLPQSASDAVSFSFLD